MKRVYWLVGGLALCTIAFFIPDARGYQFSALVSAMVGVVIFYVGLVIFILRRYPSAAGKILSAGVLILILGLAAFTGYYQHRKAVLSHDTLMQVRKVIDKGVTLSHMQTPLLKTLKTYHEQEPDLSQSMKSVFKEKYGNRVHSREEGLRFIPKKMEEHADESPHFYYKPTEDSNRVVLIGQALFIEGRDPSFQNYNGQQGMMQFRAELSEQGVAYDREN